MGVRIKEDDVKLYKFYFSEENLKSRYMSEKDRMILDLRFRDRLPIREIASRVGRSESAVRNKIRIWNRVALQSLWFTRRHKEIEI